MYGLAVRANSMTFMGKQIYTPTHQPTCWTQQSPTRRRPLREQARLHKLFSYYQKIDPSHPQLLFKHHDYNNCTMYRKNLSGSSTFIDRTVGGSNGEETENERTNHHDPHQHRLAILATNLASALEYGVGISRWRMCNKPGWLAGVGRRAVGGEAFRIGVMFQGRTDIYLDRKKDRRTDRFLKKTIFINQSPLSTTTIAKLS
ncbi:hypothetical protein F4779DRAFT_121963 [Xylariaceae sp. FL0662B]|nr:hypothetical protein F4779DRAFT_121963 [Xylariaceae sp. FL0662B]